MSSIESLVTFVKELNDVSLKPLLTELEKNPKPFTVYVNRTKDDWEKYYGINGVDIFNHLHPQQDGPSNISNSNDIQQFLNKLYNHELDLSKVVSSRNSLVSRNPIPNDDFEIEQLAPYMRFVSRKDESTSILKCLDKQLRTNFRNLPEPRKSLSIPTVAGTPGKGKTTQCRRFVEHECLSQFPADFQDLIQDCILNGRRYRVAYTPLVQSELVNPCLSISVRILHEAFKHTVFEQTNQHLSYPQIWQNCIQNYPRNVDININAVFGFISSIFNAHNSPTPLIILNLDETNSLLDSKIKSAFLREVLEILGTEITAGIPLFVLCSGTHPADLYKSMDLSSIRYKEISLPLLTTDDALAVIYDLSSLDRTSFPPSQHLIYTLDLLGVVGRYLELFILSISCIGQAAMCRATSLPTKFTRSGLKYFLQVCQNQPHQMQHAINQLISQLQLHYSRYFKEITENHYIQQIVPLLTAYSLFEYKVDRTTKIEMKGLDEEGIYTIDELENMGLIFLKIKTSSVGPIRTRKPFLVLEIPFITLHIVYRINAVNIPIIQSLYSLDSYISSEECELGSLSILMFRLWAYHQISGNYRLEKGLEKELFEIPRSFLIPSKHYRDSDSIIRYRPRFDIEHAPFQIVSKNFNEFKQNLGPNKPMAFLNRSGAPYGDAVVFCEPPIILQEKQSIISRASILEDKKPSLISSNSFYLERGKVQSNAIFVMITDERDRGGLNLDKNDFLISWDEAGTETQYTKFAGKYLSLRRITQIGIQSMIGEMDIDSE